MDRFLHLSPHPDTPTPGTIASLLRFPHPIQITGALPSHPVQITQETKDFQAGHYPRGVRLSQIPEGVASPLLMGARGAVRNSDFCNSRRPPSCSTLGVQARNCAGSRRENEDAPGQEYHVLDRYPLRN